MSEQAGVALLRVAALGVAAVLIGLVLAVFAAGASSPDEQAGIGALQLAVFFFGPLAGIGALAFIVVLALTRPASMVHRRRAARAVALAYVVVSMLLAVLLVGTWWGLLLALGSAGAAALAWWMLRTPGPGRSTQARG